MDENGEISVDNAEGIALASDLKVANGNGLHSDEAIDLGSNDSSTASDTITAESVSNPLLNGEIRTLDGEIAGDEFAADAINYQVLLQKIDTLLDKLKLDA